MRYAILAIIIIGVIHNVWGASPVCKAYGQQLFPKITTGPWNGAYVCFTDNRSANNGCYEVYVQKIDSLLDTLWNQGKAVSNSDVRVTSGWFGHRFSGDIIVSPSDSDIGVIAVWVNHHNLQLNGNHYDYPLGIYARRISSDSTFTWGNSTKTITTASTNPFALAGDGAGGVICAWMEQNGNNYYVKATRLLSNGTPFWTQTIASGTNQLGNPQLVVGNTAVVVFSSIDTFDTVNTMYSYLKLKMIDISSGGVEDSSEVTLGTNDNTYYWDCLDIPLAVYNDTLYICDREARRVRSSGCDAWYHAERLRIRLRKLAATQNGFGNPLLTEIETSVATPPSGCTGVPIENFPLRTPVIAALHDSGAVIAYTAADLFDSSEVDGRNWKLKIKYIVNNTIRSFDSLTYDYAHTPDVISTDDGGCIVSYSSYEGGSVVKTFKLNDSLNWAWNLKNILVDSSATYNCSPRLVITDPNHYIVVWACGSSRTDPDWNIYARRGSIATGQ